MKLLIVYASKYGQTRKIADRIAEVARDEGARDVFAIDSLHDDFSPAGYDRIVIAGSIYFGKHAVALQQFVTRHIVAISLVPNAFVSVSLSAMSDEGRVVANENAQAFLKLTGWDANRVALIAGGEPYTRYGFFTRFLMRRIAKKKGRAVDTKRDYEYTDWNQVDALARELVAAPTIRACSRSFSTRLTSVSA